MTWPVTPAHKGIMTRRGFAASSAERLQHLHQAVAVIRRHDGAPAKSGVLEAMFVDGSGVLRYLRS